MMTCRVGPTLHIGPFEIAVIERTVTGASLVDGVLAFAAVKEPVAVRVRHPDGSSTLTGMDGLPMASDEVGEVEGL
jgi:hypothetical protein